MSRLSVGDVVRVSAGNAFGASPTDRGTVVQIDDGRWCDVASPDYVDPYGDTFLQHMRTSALFLVERWYEARLRNDLRCFGIYAAKAAELRRRIALGASLGELDEHQREVLRHHIAAAEGLDQICREIIFGVTGGGSYCGDEAAL